MRNVITVLSSLSAEKPGLREPDTMADTTAWEYGLRARVEPDTRPLGQLTDKQRGVRAAFEARLGIG